MPDDSAPGLGGPHPPPDGPTAAPRGDPLWDDWDTPPRVPTIPVLHLDGFDGPMDLLLDLAERQRIDLGRISVVALVEQFVAAMDRLTTQVPVERRADWVVVATRLVLLRSQLTFPASPAAVAEAEQEAARAIARLDALRVVRAAAAWLQARPQLGHDVFCSASPAPWSACGRSWRRLAEPNRSRFSCRSCREPPQTGRCSPARRWAAPSWPRSNSRGGRNSRSTRMRHFGGSS
jgi:hypothetical protein